MRRRHWVWIGQAALAVLIGVFVYRAVARNWAEFRALDLRVDLDLGLVAGATAVVLLTYGALIAAWRALIIGWGERLALREAARIWSVANLARYLPGKVWSVAGLTVLAQRAGVSGWTAAGAALAMQALAVGTGACIVAVAVPGAIAPIHLLVAAVAALGAIATLAWAPLGGTFARLVSPSHTFRALPFGTAAVAAGITAGAWIAYGVAFWLLAQGLVPEAPLQLRAAVGVFAGGYLVGLIALFAPGGVGVRELMFIALLAPSMGSGPAIALSLGSRLLLTVTEVGAAAGAMIVAGRKAREMVDAKRP